MWVQTECSCHLDHKRPKDLSSKNINIELWLSACISPGLDVEMVWLTSCGHEWKEKEEEKD